LGNVRHLVRAANTVLAENPRAASRLALAAVLLAERVRHAQPVATRERALARREYSEALMEIGRANDALKQVTIARQELGDCPSADFAQALVALTRAGALYHLDRGLEAIFDIRHAAEIFARSEDLTLYTKARITEGAILYQAGRLNETLQIWSKLASERIADRPDATTAALLNNLALCFRELRDFRSSIKFYERAAAMYEQLRDHGNQTRSRWGSIKLRIAMGDLAGSLPALSRIALAFSRLGMKSEVWNVRLDQVEVLVALGEWVRARRIATKLVPSFENAGMTKRAMVALGYLRESVNSRTTTVAAVQYVRDYVTHESQSVVFTPPPRSIE
jgi:tetratricopeptide (TPR) repeat protein